MFDMDGTLIDSFDFHVKCFQRFLKNFDVNLTTDEVSKLIGNTLKKILNATMREEQHEEALDFLSGFYEKEVDDLINDLQIIDGALHTVNIIREKGIYTTILTNSKKELVENIIKKKDLNRFFDDIKGADNASLDKYTRCDNIIKKFNLDPSDVLYVGDTSHDMILAQKIGMAGCLIDCKYSWIHKEDINVDEVPVVYIVSNIEEILKII